MRTLYQLLFTLLLLSMAVASEAQSMSPSSATLKPSATQKFTAQIPGATSYNWSINPSTGSISTAGLYTAPSSVTSSSTVTVYAISPGHGTVSATVTLVPNVSISISPTWISMTNGQSAAFTAPVTGADNTAVTWSTPSVGSVTSGGVYTVPMSLNTQQSISLTAKSVIDPSKVATATIALIPTITVTVSPTSTQLTLGQSTPLNGVVNGSTNTGINWSLSPQIGTVTNGVYYAPSSIDSAQTVTVTAASQAAPGKTGSAVLSLIPVSIAVSPTTATLSSGQSKTFTTSVTGSSNTAVTWTLSPVVGTISNGVYKAPSSVTTAQKVIVTATSAADSKKNASAVVSLTASVSISMSPTSATLTGGGSTTLKATVTGASNTGVTWSMSPSVGTLSNGVYTAPSVVASAQTITVKATSAADTSKTASASISLVPVSISVSPTSATLTGGKSSTIKATLSGATNSNVTWSMSPSVGTLSGGVYTAPSIIASAQTITVKATSAADTSKTASAAISLVPVSISVSPATATLTGGKSTTLTASVTGSSNTSVTWSMSPSVGTLSNGVYTAPSTISSAQTITVKATSAADSSKSDTAAISLTPTATVSVSVSPSSASLNGGQSTTLSATVTGSSNTSVTWSMSPSVGTLSGGVYTAPSTIASAQTITVKATSAADSSKSATAAVALVPASVSISMTPPSVSLNGGQSATFAATVNGTSNTAVNWSLSPQVGTLTNGVYTAPSVVSLQQTVTVAASSAADPTKIASSIVTLVPTVSVVVTPATASLTPSQTAQFSVSLSGTTNPNVSWTISPSVGSINAGLYQAPAVINSQQNVTVTAASLADPTKTSSATIALVPTVGIALTPSSITLSGGQSTQFNVLNSGASASPTDVTWTLAPAVGTITNGVYTAPVTITTLQTIILTVVSVADPTQTAQAGISLTPSATSPTPTVTPVSLSSAFNRTGKYSDGTAFSSTGGLDLHGNAFSGNLLGTSVTFQGISFTLAAANVPDAVSNKTISLPAGQYDTLAMLGTGVNGNQANQKFTVTYTDGTTTVFTQSISDWRTTQAYSGESQAVTMSYRNVYDKTTTARTYYLYNYSFALNKAKSVKNIILPANNNVTVFALSLVASVAAPPTPPSVSPSTVTLNPSQTQQFTASNLGANPVWKIVPTTGTISSGGLYTAPSTVVSQTIITVTAVSATDSTQSASATLTLNPSAAQTPPPPPTTITLPVEVIGPDGFVVTVPFNIASGTSLSGLSLYLQVHGLRYQGQASFQLNSSAWLPINNTTMKYLGLGGVYGGIGGGFNTLKMTTPVSSASLRTGANTISFRFNGTDGISSGFRVLAFNLQDSNAKPVIPSGNFLQDDPNAWQPPSTKASDISAGQTLWQSAPLTVPTSTGPKSILARCADCHAQDGRDLKYFSFSNSSIQARSTFHGLTAQQGLQIASYIRSINVGNPGRPWNPPYQPGPGLDSQPVANWAAGAGLDAVLEADADMQPYLMPGGSTANWAANKYLNPRELPIAFQLRDWNSWLPQVHPMDAFGSTFKTKTIFTQYQNLRNELVPNDSANYSKFLGDFYNWLVLGGNKYMIPLTSPSNWDANDMRRKVYSAALWQMVKMWELNNEFGLEGMPQVVYGSRANVRGWYGGTAFSTSPFILHIPVGPGIANGTVNSLSYLDFVWYQLQIILNDGQGTQIDHEPIDYGYVDGAIRALAHVDSGYTPQAMLQMFWVVKSLQEETLSGAGPETPLGWHPPPPQVLVDFNWAPVWAGVSPSLRTTVTQAYTQVWFDQAKKYTPQQYYSGGWAKADLDPTTVSFETNFGGEVWFMLPRLVYYGVDKSLVTSIGNWAKTIWTAADWNFDVNATCSDGNHCTSGY